MSGQLKKEIRMTPRICKLRNPLYYGFPWMLQLPSGFETYWTTWEQAISCLERYYVCEKTGAMKRVWDDRH